MTRSIVCICENAGKTAAQAICTTNGDYGPGCFSVPLSTSQGVTDRAFATHWGMSGDIPDAEASALEVSLDPKVWVFDITDPITQQVISFDSQLAAMQPPLYRVIEGL